MRRLTVITVKILGARLQACFWDSLLKGPTGCHETSVNNYQFTLHNIPEGRDLIFGVNASFIASVDYLLSAFSLHAIKLSAVSSVGVFSEISTIKGPKVRRQRRNHLQNFPKLRASAILKEVGHTHTPHTHAHTHTYTHTPNTRTYHTHNHTHTHQTHTHQTHTTPNTHTHQHTQKLKPPNVSRHRHIANL